ncbi:hypothetical protein FO519_003923 [Halicephalobus sp. NKZ332]|nr:hypothetical protein FO519_003923 [Halicephalobus sp. NKZ332]
MTSLRGKVLELEGLLSFPEVTRSRAKFPGNRLLLHCHIRVRGFTTEAMFTPGVGTPTWWITDIQSQRDIGNQKIIENKKDSRSSGNTIISLIHSPKKQPNMQRQIANRTFSMKYATQQPRSHVYASFDLERDYSVDSKSDSLFRSFSRVDPQYYQFRRNELKYPPKKEPWYPKEFNPKKEVRYPPKSELPYSTEFNQNQRNHGFQNSYKSPEDSYFH